MKLKIGEKIREYRRNANMTQQQFAEKLGVSYQSVSRWENEETYPDMELLPAVAGIFKVSIDALMGIKEIEKEKQAVEAFDSLRREALKPELNVEKINGLLREIRRNYIDTENSWRPWCEGNDRCFSHPEILPEVRLTAEAYLATHPMDPHVLQTMAYIEDEEHLPAFLSKYTTSFDTSQRALLYTRYLRKWDVERLEPERRYKFFEAVSDLLHPCVLRGIRTENEDKDEVTVFRKKLLDLIRDHPDNDVADMWVDDRLEVGIKYASILARNGDLIGAVNRLESVVSLLETTMRITARQELPTSCRWLDGMVWNAEEKWFQKGNNPDESEERATYIYTEMSGMQTCYMIYPSTYYDDISRIEGDIQSMPEYQNLLERVKNLIEKRPHQHE